MAHHPDIGTLICSSQQCTNISPPKRLITSASVFARSHSSSCEDLRAHGVSAAAHRDADKSLRKISRAGVRVLHVDRDHAIVEDIASRCITE